MSIEPDSAAWFRRDNAWRERMLMRQAAYQRQMRIEREDRASERLSSPRVELALDALIDAIGKRVDGGAEWDRVKRRHYAEHLIQSWCECGPESSDMGDPPWGLCAHARDEGF